MYGDNYFIISACKARRQRLLNIFVIGLTKLRFVPRNDKARRQRFLNVFSLFQQRARRSLRF